VDLSERQKQILLAIINEFITSEEPVGSEVINSKYAVTASPATIRYEMVRLSEKGLIEKEYASAGRVPTALGIRYYLSSLMDSSDVDVMLEVRLRQLIHKLRYERDKLLKEILLFLTETTKCAALIITQSGMVYSGIYNLIDQFTDKEQLKQILLLLDDANILRDLLQRNAEMDQVKVFIGEETEFKSLQESSIVYTKVNVQNGEQIIICILGSKRINYSEIIPVLKLLAKTINQRNNGW
jgi:transcriptional regulator of heat shock response